MIPSISTRLASLVPQRARALLPGRQDPDQSSGREAAGLSGLALILLVQAVMLWIVVNPV